MEMCPFCQLPDERVLWQSEQTLALYDQYPVSPGHLLLITKRHVPTYFDATLEEQNALWNSLEALKQLIEQKYQPRGYHVGFNAGEAAGQTVRHLHVHFIPKYSDENPTSIQDIIALAPQRPGRRDVSPEALQPQTTRAIERFFDAKPKEESLTLSPEDIETWSAELCLSDADGKGLFLWLSPLRGLPSFVKEVTLSSSTPQRLVGANIRANACQLKVSPSTSAYTFTANIEDEPELQEALSRLNTPGVSRNAPTLFRIDASGVGRRMMGSTLTPGQQYRVLLPPGSEAHDDGWSLEGGWQVFEVAVLQSSPEVSQFLQSNQLSLGASEISVQLAGATPTRYDENNRGERFACFTSGQSICVAIKAPQTLEAFLLFAGPDGILQKPLPPNESWNLALEASEPGRYAVEIVPVETRFARAKLFFTIEEDPTRTIPARATFTLNGATSTLGESSSLECDLAALTAETISIQAPPLWPVFVYWRGQQPRRFDKMFANEKGDVDLSWVLQETKRARGEERDAELFFDVGELGSLRLQTEKQFSPERFFSRLETLWNERRNILSTGASLPAILQQWIEPVCRLLGYSLQQIAAEQVSAILWQGIQQKKSRALVLLPVGSDMTSAANTIKTLCQEHQLTHGIITDGLRWMPFEVGLPMMLTIEFGKLFAPGDEMLRAMMVHSFLAR